MSKKTLLNENTIRRFMKLAEIEALTSPFLETRDPLEEDEPGGDPVYEQEEELDVDIDALGAEELGAEELGAEELGAEEDLDIDMEDEEGLEDEEEEEDPMDELTADLADAIGDFLRDKIEDGTLEITTGEDAEEIDLEDDDEGLEGLENEEAFGAGLEVGAEEELGAEEEEEAELEEAWGSKKHEFTREEEGGVEKKAGVKGGRKYGKGGHYKAYEKQEESLVAEVARRVARRILTSRRR